ncbi:MAG: MotA/TolQ/ExbB proton channel family protein [Opitutales bacterium]|nr:MotA/TolQ/ExbB proton channel family protein [Opitutales bacterium]
MPDPAQAAQAAEAAQHITAMPTDLFGFIAGTWDVWVDGGWVMIPLALLAIYTYFEAAALVMHLRRTRINKTPQGQWEQWIDSPEEGTGHVGDIIRYVTGNGICRNSVLPRIAAVRQAMIPEVNQKIVLLSVLVTVAPLLGLLGTVIGMLTTFKGLSVNTGQTIDLVAEGIRVALITTQTGLQVAIPGYIFLSVLVKKRNEYNAFLASLESTLVQKATRLEHAQQDEASA